MTDYATQDAPIDRLLWQAIADIPIGLRREVADYANKHAIEVVRYRLDVDFLPCS